MRPPLIIGGGPAGAAAAAVIAAAGHPVTLLERSTGPADKLCGDFLSGGAVAALRRLALDPLTIGGVPVRTIRLMHRRSVAETPLPFAAVGLSRRRLDEALLRLAQQRGAEILRGQTVRALDRTPSGFVARTATASAHRADASHNADTAYCADSSHCADASHNAYTSHNADASHNAHTLHYADTVFLATGKHDLRSHARPSRANGLLGLKMYYDVAPDQAAALHGCIELSLVRGGYAGLQLVEQGRAVLCMLLPAERYRQVGANWDALLDDLADEAPWLQHRLAGATACLERPLAIAGVPYGHLHRSQRHAPPDLYRLGDQGCVVPSFAGDGMAIALQSAIAAASTWLQGGTAADYHIRFARQAGLPMRFASLIHLACLSTVMQPLVVAASRLWPPALRLAASLTRVARPA